MSDEARRAAGILAQCKWLRDQISKWEAQAKEVIAGELSGGERTKAVAADGTEIGSVARAEGARSMQIDNEEGFLMWVKGRYPHEVVETVRPAFIKLCAEKVKVLGGLPDANGELCPHVSLAQAEPKATVQLKDQDRLVIEDMFMHRHIPEVMAQMAPAELPLQPSVTCPQCGSTSYHPEDVRQKYCGRCHIFWGGDLGEVLIPPATPESNDSPCQDVGGPGHNDPETPIEEEPFIEEGPPDWPESNTFETSDVVHQRRMR